MTAQAGRALTDNTDGRRPDDIRGRRPDPPWPVETRAYSKRVPRTNCALRLKKCAPRIPSGIYF